MRYARPDPPPYDGKTTAEVHDYHELTGVLASSLAKRVPGYTSLGIPDPRKLPEARSRICLTHPILPSFLAIQVSLAGW